MKESFFILIRLSLMASLVLGSVTPSFATDPFICDIRVLAPDHNPDELLLNAVETALQNNNDKVVVLTSNDNYWQHLFTQFTEMAENDIPALFPMSMDIVGPNIVLNFKSAMGRIVIPATAVPTYLNNTALSAWQR